MGITFYLLIGRDDRSFASEPENLTIKCESSKNHHSVQKVFMSQDISSYLQIAVDKVIL